MAKPSVFRPLLIAFVFLSVAHELRAQTILPDMTTLSDWSIINRNADFVKAETKKNVIHLNEGTNDGGLIWTKQDFSEGIIEVDLKGRNVLQKSFIGIAFHIQENNFYDVIYFRPFNFMNPDTLRRSRAVQYISAPDYPWQKLREQFPGKYENKVKPVPDADSWFHAKIVVDGKKIKVYVDNSGTSSLEVEKLTNSKTGKIGLWVGSDSDGSFANLKITPKK